MHDHYARYARFDRAGGLVLRFDLRDLINP
jgi:hypothetical protein